MSLISRHILRTLAAPFVWSLLALTGMLLLNQLGPLIDRFGGKGLDLMVMVEAVVLAIPALTVLTLPMSVLTATLYGYSQLAGDLEMMAMYANGLSVWRMVRPALVAAAVIAGVNFVIFDQLVPLSNSRFAQLRRDVSQKTPTLAFKPHVLNAIPPTGPRFYLRATNIEQVTGALTDVLIYDLTYDARRVIRADSGFMHQSPDERDLLLTLYNGETRDYRSLEPGRVERTSYARSEITIRDVASQLERSAVTGADERSMSTCQLMDRVLETRWDHEEGDRRREEFTRRDLRSLAQLPPVPPSAVRVPPSLEANCGAYRHVGRWIERLLLPAPAGAQDVVRPVPQQDTAGSQDTVRPTLRPLDSAARQRRDSLARAAAESVAAASAVPQDPAVVQPLDSSAFMPPPLMPDSLPFLVPGTVPAAPTNGLAAAVMDVSAARSQSQNALDMMRRYAVEYHKKFALPLSAFGFVLLGVSLALKFPRGGIGLVIGGSLVIFMVFYVLLIGGEGIADKGIIPATVAMYGPLALLTGGGLVALAAANREMGTGRGAGFGAALRRLFRRKEP